MCSPRWGSHCKIRESGGRHRCLANDGQQWPQRAGDWKGPRQKHGKWISEAAAAVEAAVEEAPAMENLEAAAPAEEAPAVHQAVLKEAPTVESRTCIGSARIAGSTSGGAGS